MTAAPQPVAIDALWSHGAMVSPGVPVRVESSSEQWAYAVSVPLGLEDGRSLPALLTVKATLESGRLGCLVVQEDWTTVVGTTAAATEPGKHTLTLVWTHGQPAHLVFRNIGADNRPCVFRIESVELLPDAEALRDDVSRLAEVLDAAGARIDVSRLHEAAARCP